jgi:hypothetical protein
MSSRVRWFLVISLAWGIAFVVLVMVHPLPFATHMTKWSSGKNLTAASSPVLWAFGWRRVRAG